MLRTVAEQPVIDAPSSTHLADEAAARRIASSWSSDACNSENAAYSALRRASIAARPPGGGPKKPVTRAELFTALEKFCRPRLAQEGDATQARPVAIAARHAFFIFRQRTREAETAPPTARFLLPILFPHRSLATMVRRATPETRPPPLLSCKRIENAFSACRAERPLPQSATRPRPGKDRPHLSIVIFRVAALNLPWLPSPL